MNQVIFILISIFAFSCKNESIDESGKTLDFKTFSLQVPDNWAPYQSQGYDSQVGGIENKTDTLKYDYGWYSYQFGNQKDDTHIRQETMIDGRKALIVKPRKKGDGLIGVCIWVDDVNRLSIMGVSKNEEEVIRIFKSVKFK